VQDLQERLSASLVREPPGQKPLQEWYGPAQGICGAFRIADILYIARRAVERWAGQAERYAARYEVPLSPLSSFHVPGLRDIVEGILTTESPTGQRRLAETAAQILRAARQEASHLRGRRGWLSWCREYLERLREVVFEIPEPAERTIALTRCAEAEATWMVRGWIHTYRAAFRTVRLLHEPERRSRLRRQTVESLLQFAGWRSLEVVKLALAETRRIEVGEEKEAALEAVACALMRHHHLDALRLWREVVRILQSLVLSREGGRAGKVVLACWCRWLQEMSAQVPGDLLIQRLMDLADHHLTGLWRPVPYLLALAIISSITSLADLPPLTWEPVRRRHLRLLQRLEQMRCEILLQARQPPQDL
jgi:hypothetical protein